MTPSQYEQYIGDYFREKGFDVIVTPFSNDWGLDIIANKGDEKIGIQVKMYGNSNRKVNREAIMTLSGAAHYQDCTKAIIVTDGEIMSDAKKVADKLGIQILYMPANTIIMEGLSTKEETKPILYNQGHDSFPSFDDMWGKYIIPLKGHELSNSRGTNIILDVNWGGIKRITSQGKEGKIDIEGFKLAYNELLEKGIVRRDYINQQIAKRCSSGIVLILSQVPFIEGDTSELRLKRK